MKKLLIAAIAVATLILSATVTQVYAGDKIVTTTSNCGSSYNRVAGRGSSDCETTTVIQNLKSWKEMNAEERAEVRAEENATATRVAKWEAFCKPVVKQDINGVNRYHYAHKNCDMGRSE